MYYCLTRARLCSALRFVKAPTGRSSRTCARALCERCRRPTSVCYCAHITPLQTRTRVIVLQHPRERDVGIGTARIARLCLPGAVLRVGIDFSDDPVVQAALASGETMSSIQGRRRAMWSPWRLVSP